MSAALIAARFVHFAAGMILFGSSLFALYAGIGRQAGAAAADHRTGLRIARLQRWCALASLIGSAGWFACVAAEMAGRPEDAFDGETLQLVLFETHFGAVWQIELALAVLIVAVIWLPGPFRRRFSHPGFVLVVSAGLLIGAAAAGHAAMDTGPAGALHIAVDALHLLAAAAWLGGLVPLGFVLRRSLDGSLARHCLARFSSMGVGAACVLVSSGLPNAWLLVGSRAEDVFATEWGRMLALKLALVATLLAIAAVNRLRLAPRVTSQSPFDAPAALSALIRNVAVEQALGVLILAVASALGTLPPPLGAG